MGSATSGPLDIGCPARRARDSAGPLGVSRCVGLTRQLNAKPQPSGMECHLFKLVNRHTQAAVCALLLVLASSPASAAISTTDITAAGTDIAAIGLAVFGIMVAIKLWKWVRRVL
jgi:hypothetical protein